MKLKEKFKAIKLRKSGISYSEINKIVRVSKSTLSAWLRDIELTEKQKQKILKGLELSRYVAASNKKTERIKRTRDIIEKSKIDFVKLSKNSLFLVGLSLYWAEGDKHRGERVKFTNSDPVMIKLILKWFREICQVPEKKFRVALHVHNLYTSINVKKYWSNLTSIPISQFNKIYVKQSTLRQRRNILYNGTCGIVVNSRSLFRTICGWKEALLNYFNMPP